MLIRPGATTQPGIERLDPSQPRHVSGDDAAGDGNVEAEWSRRAPSMVTIRKAPQMA